MSQNASRNDGARRGRFITFEGPDGSGKTTQVARLAAALERRGIPVVSTREPGGSPGADAVRHIVLSGAVEELGVETEAILFAAARFDHVQTLILPALRAGAVVLCDRFLDSTRAYQGSSPGFDGALLCELEAATTNDVRPDLTFILDLPTEVSFRRTAERRGSANIDRFEKDGLALQEARRQAFLEIARREPDRCVVIDATDPLDEISVKIESLSLERFFDDFASAPGERTAR